MDNMSIDTLPICEDLRDMLRAYVDAVRSLPSVDTVGVYLHGSLAVGGWNPLHSDVDFAALQRRPLGDAELRALAEMHERLVRAHPAAVRLDGRYVPLERAGSYRRGLVPSCREGRVVPGRPGDVNAVMWHTLRTRGIALFGPQAADLVPPVTRDDLMENMRFNLEFLSRRMPVYLLGGTESTVFGVLSLCRVLHTLCTSEIVSKEEAAEWALGEIDDRWHPLVRCATRRYADGDFVGRDLLLTRHARGFLVSIRERTRQSA